MKTIVKLNVYGGFCFWAGAAKRISKHFSMINSEIETAYIELHEKRAEMERSFLESIRQNIS